MTRNDAAREAREASSDDGQLRLLAELLQSRNAIDLEIVAILGRPATTGNLGEFIASRIFGIRLATSGVNAGHDGWFEAGPLTGKTVNVKLYSQDDGLLDISAHPADYYLVMRGPRATSTRGRGLPFQIDSVYLFELSRLRIALVAAGVKVGVATSVRRPLWDAARIYPATPGSPIELTDGQIAMLRGFGAAG